MSQSRPDTGCAALRVGLGEPLHGTAPEGASSWLLVEHPGPWPSAGWPADLPAAAAGVLEAAVALSVRPQLIRPVHERRRRTRSRVLVASCRPGRNWLEVRELPDLRELADLDLPDVAQGRAPGYVRLSSRAAGGTHDRPSVRRVVELLGLPQRVVA